MNGPSLEVEKSIQACSLEVKRRIGMKEKLDCTVPPCTDDSHLTAALDTIGFFREFRDRLGIAGPLTPLTRTETTDAP